MLQIIFLLLGIPLYVYFSRKKPGPSLPPGPRPIPLIGNVRDLPPKGKPEYQHWLKFKDIYGPISCVSIFGQSLILIHDRHVLYDLLEKSAIKTSGRPYSYFGTTLCGFGDFLPWLQYDAAFQDHRKMVHRQLGTKAVVSRFADIQDVESRRLLLRILNDPGNLIKNLKTEASAIILQMTYGYSVEADKPDPLVRLIERTIDNGALAFVPLAWPVDRVPFLEHLPEGLPGTSYKAIARKWSELCRLTIETPYEFVRRQMAQGNDRLSYVSSLIQQHVEDDGDTLSLDNATFIKNTAATMYATGSDTTASSLYSFVLAMTLFPDVQRKAKEEIESIVGTDRLPQFADRDKLPYVNAVVKETLRWFPVLPLGLPHVTTEEIIYEGYRIPQGAYLMASIWWFLHDPQTYPNPSTFDPERYLEPRDEPDPVNDVFGYARRICPGRFLADESLFINIARLLAVFDIQKAVDDLGNEIDPNVEAIPGLLGRPVEFPYSIKPRSSRHMDLIRSVEVDHPWEKGDSSLLQGDLNAALADA